MRRYSVEGIWQGLKVFEKEDVDINLFSNNTMKNLKRTCRKHGSIIGHRMGVNGEDILDYISAKQRIYIPTYKWVLDNVVNHIIEKMRVACQKSDLVLLDYNTSEDVNSLTKPLSHAYLIKAYIQGTYPYAENVSTIITSKQ